jgi:hypothetical protein
MSDYAHVPGGSLKFKGTGEKYVPIPTTLPQPQIEGLTIPGRRRRNHIHRVNDPKLNQKSNNPIDRLKRNPRERAERKELKVERLRLGM